MTNDKYDTITYVNGDWIRWSEVHIDPDDIGFQLGDVVFEYARTFSGKPFTWEEHISRLWRSLKYVRNDARDMTADEMLTLHYEVVERNKHCLKAVGDWNIIPFITRGTSFNGPANVFLRVKQIPWGQFVPWYDHGSHGVIVKTRSCPSQSLDPKVKHHSRLNMVLAHQEAGDIDPRGLPIMLDLSGNISEGAGFNVVVIKNGAVNTPTDTSSLQGISHQVTLRLAKKLDIPVIETEIQPYDLYTADEIFFTRSTPCIVPCTRVDNRDIGDGFPGPITKQLITAYSERVGLDIVDQARHYAAKTKGFYDGWRGSWHNAS